MNDLPCIDWHVISFQKHDHSIARHHHVLLAPRALHSGHEFHRRIAPDRNLAFHVGSQDLVGKLWDPRVQAETLELGLSSADFLILCLPFQA